MIIYPAIDLRGGRVVRLTEGRFDQEKSYGDDPLAVAQDFAASGATWLHVVDLDGAKDPAKRQTALVEKIARGSGLRMQTGGGIRDESQIAALLAAGAQRVIVGSVAVRQPALVHDWLRKFGPEKIILSPDVRLDVAGIPRVAAAGWQESTGVALDDFLTGFLLAGLVHILCTDISRDGKLTGPNRALYARLVKKFPSLQIQASGGVSSLDDLRGLKTTGSAGAIVGRALYEKKFTLKEALAC
ncbi:1-(5-phosphoribosyl)-5-[(5-phosphoribosylamino)methylideneamino]imidazole-4-carboxamide isomerase [Opitutus sp. GAS368]|jgi:phosphoribosylformimino-5-aminoimidazole carboxamide ribotide isomerase|uniref:1-(5-phosphoribosyl)-5-[(5- phosphoribosylamino)methylideneamino]imidazole-4- carboxamide isomerase n=1 Tax=Opitutus sp. GAS368 TaxID=1882749 RepID=UPI00087B6F33|nr:1-(5-phosphoribosyl)-5-[(5-phosphoribosylamino)methylideneamino]imidazole-4-carboxamide isomerase [Opitutus sp. GAS368]SDR98054.1 1-(5-phosphoribosyl)-5-[(5-phosphoribosylamino)methylideneamino] imidazole-4-carboxamide isomerase [Opitutus sp. GAS368]